MTQEQERVLQVRGAESALDHEKILNHGKCFEFDPKGNDEPLNSICTAKT